MIKYNNVSKLTFKSKVLGLYARVNIIRKRLFACSPEPKMDNGGRLRFYTY